MFTELKTAAELINVSGNRILPRKQIRSISSYSSNNIFYFPFIVPDDVAAPVAMTHAKMFERDCAIFVMACISLIPFYRINSAERSSIEDYLKTFHQNIGMSPGNSIGDKLIAMTESLSYEERAFAEMFINCGANIGTYVSYVNENIASVYELSTGTNLNTPIAEALMRKYDEIYQQKINEDVELSLELHPDTLISNAGSRQSDTQHTYQREKIFTDLEMKKANDKIPTTFTANVGFIISDTDETITKDITIGVKAYIHKLPATVVIKDLVDTIKRKRKFLKAVKYFTGEEGTLADLIIGIEDVKIDAQNEKIFERKILNQIKRRSEVRNLSIPFIMKNYTPNAGYIITTSMVDFIKNEYGIDVRQSAKMIMDQSFLLMFAITDQTNEITQIMYDGQNYVFQEYSYQSLERESNSTDRALRELYRSVSTRGGAY